MPVRQFWALTVYDRATFAFIDSDSDCTNLSSYDLLKMKKNDDGSATLYVGPTAPACLESNWIPKEARKKSRPSCHPIRHSSPPPITSQQTIRRTCAQNVRPIAGQTAHVPAARPSTLPRSSNGRCG